jgi:hypothetical protein
LLIKSIHYKYKKVTTIRISFKLLCVKKFHAAFHSLQSHRRKAAMSAIATLGAALCMVFRGPTSRIVWTNAESVDRGCCRTRPRPRSQSARRRLAHTTLASTTTATTYLLHLQPMGVVWPRATSGGAELSSIHWTLCPSLWNHSVARK